ncbi:unnamed protein product [Hermetia illucens]|uniref:2-aminoethanethiol dioxygenase n=2 Tax=Hermetia illucens TaxID=343691 RepID=A0A7R8UMM0_HERIL|nr:2-aminoethanethiol dioxygenase [Hermetia illucens]CAD7083606.1 unnamed protein product [Hermetia illucens]
MSQLFARVVRQAIATFDRKNVASFNKNFSVLKQLVDQLTPCDINLNMDLTTDEAFSRVGKAPVTYVNLMEDEEFEFSVFILRSGFTMPLHDHPVMHGILKVMSGSAMIESFTKEEATGSAGQQLLYDPDAVRIEVVQDEPRLCTNNDESVVLTPTKRNYHEITAVGGVAAFFDILSPPYDSNIPFYGRRKCSYYRVIPRNGESGKRTLERIPPPRDFYCDRGNYEPPDFLRA